MNQGLAPIRKRIDRNAFTELNQREDTLNIGQLETKNGYGACKLCNCDGYQSRNDGTHVCKVCKHHKSQHGN